MKAHQVKIGIYTGRGGFLGELTVAREDAAAEGTRCVLIANERYGLADCYWDYLAR